eukprot:205000_1
MLRMLESSGVCFGASLPKWFAPDPALSCQSPSTKESADKLPTPTNMIHPLNLPPLSAIPTTYTYCLELYHWYLHCGLLCLLELVVVWFGINFTFKSAGITTTRITIRSKQKPTKITQEQETNSARI